jgi:DNA-binding response OmpR family regulator
VPRGSQADYECRAVSDGCAALELIEQLGEPPALVVTDIRMPRMSGVELGRRIRVLHPGLPVLYVCADDADLPPGTRQWLLKLFPPEQLDTQLRAMLGSDQGEIARE